MEGMIGSIEENLFVISRNVPIAFGFSWGLKSEAPFDNDFYKDCFGAECIKHFVKNLLDIESKFKIKLSKPMVLTT